MRYTKLCLLLSALGFSAQAQAYLDPGTGSMIISAIVGVFATLALAIKTYWYRLLGLFRRKSTSAARAAAGDDKTGA